MRMNKNKLHLLIFIIGATYLFFEFSRGVSLNRQSSTEFRSSWTTSLTATVDSFDIINSDAGIVFLTIKNIEGNIHHLDNFKGEPFYLITNQNRAKLLEGGLSEWEIDDTIEINSSGSLSLIRNGKVITSRPIHIRKYKKFWSLIDLDKVTNDWQW